MSKQVDSKCTCDCGRSMAGKGDAAPRAMLAGAIGGIVAVAALAILAAVMLRRVGPRLMPRMMERMMRDCDCSPEMKACMEKCGCGPRPDETRQAETPGDEPVRS